MRENVVHFHSMAALSSAAAGVMRLQLARPPAGPWALLLTGGLTVRPVYRALLASDTSAGRSGLHLMLSDERMVPQDADASNRLAVAPLCKALGVPLARRIFPDGALGPERAATEYHDRLRAFLDAGGRIPLGLLGIGADGHVASLFDGDDLERGHDRLALPVWRPHPPDRVSVTPSLLERVDQLIVMAAGPDKRRSIERLAAGDNGLTAVRALAGAQQLLIWHTSEPMAETVQPIRRGI